MKIMSLDKLETHDRLQYVTSQSFNIGECCQNLIDQKPFGEHAFYIFAHTRTEPDGATKRLIWQPRLTKPKAQTNSMLFKAYPGTDKVKVIWMIPAEELWTQFMKGKLTESHAIFDSICKFLENRNELEKKEPDDLSDEEINDIYQHISLKSKRDSLVACPSVSETQLPCQHQI